MFACWRWSIDSHAKRSTYGFAIIQTRMVSSVYTDVNVILGISLYMYVRTTSYFIITESDNGDRTSSGLVDIGE